MAFFLVLLLTPSWPIDAAPAVAFSESAMMRFFLPEQLTSIGGRNRPRCSKRSWTHAGKHPSVGRVARIRLKEHEIKFLLVELILLVHSVATGHT